MEVKMNTWNSNTVYIVKQKISKQEEGNIGEVMKSESECQYEIEDAVDEVSWLIRMIPVSKQNDWRRSGVLLTSEVAWKNKFVFTSLRRRYLQLAVSDLSFTSDNIDNYYQVLNSIQPRLFTNVFPTKSF